MTHLVDNLRFVWLGSLGLLSLQKVELSIRKVEMLSQVLLNWMTQEVSVLLYQFVKWLQCHKMSLSKQTDHILVPEWAWTVSHQSRNLWMFKSDLHHGDVHRSFYLHGANWQSREYCRTHHPVCVYHVPCTGKIWQWFGDLEIQSWSTSMCKSLSNFVMWCMHSSSPLHMCVHVTKPAEMTVYKERMAVFPILSMWGLQWTHPGYYWSLIWLQLWKCIMDPWITPVWASRVNCAYFCHLKYQTCVIIKGWLGATKNTCTCIELWTRNNWLEYSTVKLLCLVQGGKKCSIWWLMGLLS